MKAKTPVWIAALTLGLSSFLFASVEDSIDTILKVDHEGSGNEAASAAWSDLSAATMEEIPKILSRMQDANPLAANYLRTAVQAIVDREEEAGNYLPLIDLGELLLDVRQDPGARSLAFDLIRKSRPDVAETLIPGLINDPSNDLRRLAVARIIDHAVDRSDSEDRAESIMLYRQALNAARDVDQIDVIARALREMDQEVDLPRHFGFLMRWKTIAPFDNTGREGFNTVYPPEEELDLEATYKGKEGAEAKWVETISTDEYGKVDLNQPHGFLKEVVGYAYTTFESESTMPVELRLGCKNAWKIWVNGELIFGRDEYHRGQRIDQYILKATMQEGTNEILVKLCQNEQEQDWTVQWEFQLRVCDSTGTAILSEDRLPTPKPEAATRRPNQG